MSNSPSFKSIIDEGLSDGSIRYFNDEEWGKIKSQNFISPLKELKNFFDLFIYGYNKGNCVGCSRQLSYSFNDVDIVSGTLELFKGTLNAEKEGGHCWLENDRYIIDTSLLLVIDKKYKDKIGYFEEQRVSKFDLMKNSKYQARKEFVNDNSINKSHL